MKSIVIYYSETGNTEKVAKAIAVNLGADLKRIEEIKIDDVSKYDLICLGTPVHAFAPAKIVRRFLKELPNLPSKKGAAFCTMHAFGDKRTFKIIKENFEAKGISFIDGFSCIGLSRLVGNFGPRIFNRGRPSKKDLKNAESFGKNILNSIKNH